ncbi:hypothetical protein PHISP_00513 [Aspergillus sp. HF37]|nr:hypothetical protein PHISP_00513 [Aspergillus sp. HF37]
MPHIYETCHKEPSHVVVHRVYKLCGHPRNVGTYRHCSDDYVEPSQEFTFGSSRVNGPCPACVGPGKTRVVVYIYNK